MKNIILLIAFLSLVQALKAQNTIKGSVLSSENRRPIEGVSIKELNTNKEYTSDKNGLFILPDIPYKSKVQFKHLGYLSQLIDVQFPVDSELVIYMKKDPRILDEVVVSTGYQEISKERATGSFTFVDNDLFNQQVGTNVLERLESTTSGYSIYRDQNGEKRIMIRGNSTINGPKEPLVILDNFPYEGDIENLNPNDVENITILKDAAAASIWGTRAGNGVIVITTKKGKFNQPIQVEFNSDITVANKPDLFYLNEISSSDFIDVEKMLYEKGYYASSIASYAKPPLSPVIELLLRKGVDAETEINNLRGHDVRKDFQRYLYEKALNQRYYLNVSGGSSHYSWTLSSGYDHSKDQLGTGNSRLNLRFRNTFQPVNNLKVTFGAGYTNREGKSGRPGYSDVSLSTGSIYPYAKFADSKGNPLPVVKKYRKSFIDTVGNGRLLNWEYYPLEDYKQDINEREVHEILAEFGLDYAVFKGVDVDLRYKYGKQVEQGRHRQTKDSYYTRDLINTLAEFDPETGSVINNMPVGDILDLSHTSLVTQDLRGQVNTNKEIGNGELTFLVGGEIRANRTVSSNDRTYGYNNENLTYSNIDLNKMYTSLVTGGAVFLPQVKGFGDFSYNYISMFANGSYLYKDRYMLSASARRDASNLFGVRTNDKWTPLWSVGAAWDLSEEDFYNFLSLPYMKLRVTYGYSGNVSIGRSALTTISILSTSRYTGLPYARFNEFANPSLRWERVATLNIGADFNNRLNTIYGSLEYYRKRGTDLYGTSPVDYTGVPAFSLIKNTAGMTASGFDLTLNSKNVDRAFTWSSVLNLNIYHDKVTRYYLKNLSGSNYLNGGAQIAGLEGKPIYSVFSYRWAGLDKQTGDPLGYLDGEITNDYNKLTGSNTLITDLKFNGPAMPTFIGSFGNNFTFKSFYLNIRLSGKFGYYFKKRSINYSSLFSGNNGHSDYQLRWQESGDEEFTDVPSMVYPANSNRDNFYNDSEVLIEKGDHIRLNYLQLGYVFEKLQQGNPLKNLKVYLFAENLGILWKQAKGNQDPDYFSGTIPEPFSISIGIKGNFKSTK